ncbi:MAG: reverse transcriptase family protein [Polyangiaceae bacterium]
MSGESDRTVAATPLAVLDPDSLPRTPADDRAKAARAARLEARSDDAVRWKAIEEAGGTDAWVNAELRKKGLLVDESSPDGDKASFKERKKAEAEARRALLKLVWRAYHATHVNHVGAGIFFADREAETTQEREARAARALSNDLAALDGVEAMAKSLGLAIPQLRWLCFHREVATHSHYQLWTIPKRDGSRRQIAAPKRELKAAQRWLLRKVVEKLPVHAAAHGFLRARSIATNAAAHAGAACIVKIDVKDFFPTITFRRVKGLFRKGGLPEGVATLCALLATESPREVIQFRGKTLFVAKGPRACPQGAPTSPAITNAICLRLDRRLSGLARQLRFRYTRYADDLTFSYQPGDSASSRAPVGALLHGVSVILESEGFRVHKKKTAVMRSGGTQRVTGLVVNKASDAAAPAARVPRETVRKLRAALFNREHGRPAKGGETLDQLRGMAAFIHMTDAKKGRAFLDRIDALEAATAKSK